MAAYEYSAADIVAAPIAVSAHTQEYLFCIFSSDYSHPTSYVTEMRLMVSDKKILYLKHRNVNGTMKRTNTILSRTGFSIAFMAALSLTIMITSMCLIQQGDNVASATSQNATVITSDNHTSVVAPNQYTVTGQLIYEAHGKIVAQKVINSGKTDGAKIQVSYSGSGKFTNGLDVTELWTFVNTHRLNGVIHGVGQGIIKTIDNKEIALATGYGRGFTGVGGKIVYPTAQLYSTNSTGRLAFLNEIVRFSQWQVDNSGNYSYKMWEFK